MESIYKNQMLPEKLPNALAVLLLGILSLPLCCCWGVGAIAGGIGLYLADKDSKLYKQNPANFTNYSLLKAGKILCIIGVVLSIIAVFINVFARMYYSEQDILEMQQRILEQYGR